MQNLKLTLTGLTFLSLATLAGCSFPGVYKIDIQQGNVVTQDMIDQLRPGMTRRQVRFIMGSPLVTDTFHANRWDYLYSMQPGGGQRQQERVSLVFDDSDHLVGLAGDFKPGTSREQEIMGTSGETTAPEPSSTPESQPQPQPQDEQPSAPGSTEDQIQQEIDKAQTEPVPTPAPIDTRSE
jgi:outer membrane protein assembly factor BamE